MRRSLAAVVDIFLILILTGLLASTTGRYFAERAVVTFRVYSPDSWWNGPVPLVLGAFSTISYGLAFAVVAVLLAEGLWGASPGKLVCRCRVTVVDKGHPQRGIWLRFALKTAAWWLFCLGLLVGRWELVAVGALAGAWALLDLVISPWHGRGLWYDRLAGTDVAPISPAESHTPKHR